jgi:RND family efflux transporter, MFP subunit
MRPFQYLFTGCCLLSALADSAEFRVILEPRYKTEISSEVNSTITKIDRRMGEAFEKDALLMELDDTLYQAQYKKALGLVEKFKTELEAQERLFQSKVSSIAELFAAKAALITAQADLIIAERALERCKIFAPYSGNIVELFVELHERVEPGQKLLKIQDDTVLFAKLLLPSSILPLISIGKKIELRISGGSTVAEATISRIGTVIDPASNLVKVDAEINNEKRTLIPGMLALIQLGDPTPAP